MEKIFRKTGNIKLDYHFDGFELDTNQFPHDQDRKYIALIDQHVTEKAARYIKQQGPDLSWVYLEYPDDMGHRYGDSQQLYDAVVLADRQVGQIWESIQYRQGQHEEEWLMIVTTDHGRDADTGKHHGGQSEREQTIWITTNATGLNHYFHKSEPAMVDIMPTIARFMEFEVPENLAREIDGVPLIGPVSLTSPKVSLQGNTLQVSWQAIEKKGKVKVWLSNTNRFKENGQADTYTLKAEVPLAKEKCTLELGQQPLGFYKIVLEGPHNSVNQWIMTEK